MAIEGQEVQAPAEPPSLRESLDAAIEKVEAPAQETSSGDAPAKNVADFDLQPSGNVVDLNKPGDTAKVKSPPEFDSAPKSWKPNAQSKWAGVDPEIRAEVHRREKEVSRVFGETNGIREHVKQFSETIRPFEARIRSSGMQPLELVGELLKSDYILSSAPAVARAEFMASLIKQYGVDIRALDSALAGEKVEDPVTSRVEALLAERLSPLQAFMNQQQQIARSQEQQILTEAASTIEAIATDSAKYPHYEAVRQDMADIIEMNARRNVYLTPDQAYTRAVAMNPEWGAQAALQVNNGRQLQQARDLNSRAQRALNASSSTSGAPGGSPVGGVNTSSSLRDTIEAAFNQVAGR